MIRGATIVWAVLVLLSSGGLFLMKLKVQALEERLLFLNSTIRETHKSIRILSAEWSYLNDPARIADLATRLLGLQPLGTEAFVTFAELPAAVSSQPSVPEGSQDKGEGLP